MIYENLDLGMVSSNLLSRQSVFLVLAGHLHIPVDQNSSATVGRSEHCLVPVAAYAVDAPCIAAASLDVADASAAGYESFADARTAAMFPVD